MKSLSWGPDDTKIEKKFNIVIPKTLGDGLFLGSVILQNFPGDCGALILQRANYVDLDTLKVVNKIASFCGFSKIFATVVCSSERASNQKEIFRKARWKLTHSGVSNRNPHKTDLVFVKYIRNCEYKGY